MTPTLLIPAVLILLALGLVMPALWGRRDKSTDAAERSRFVYQSRLREIEQELKSETLGLAQSQQARRDLERDVLAMLPADASEQARTRPWARWVIVLVIPLVSLLAYAAFKHEVDRSAQAMAQSAPAAGQGSESMPSVPEMVARLQERLKASPGDARGWQLLGRSLAVLQRYGESAAAYAKANELTGYKEPLTLVAQAEAMSYAADKQVDDVAMDLLGKAVALDPQQPKALWLLGWGKYQREDYAGAVRVWKTLEALVADDTGLKQLIGQYLADAASHLKGSEPAPKGAVASSSPIIKSELPVTEAPISTAAADAGIEVQVTLAPELKAKISPTDTLFIYAKTAEGSPAPLAMVRRKAGALPLKVRLDDSTAMIPSHRLSGASEVVIVARVSKSGLANPQPGDLQGQSERMNVKATTVVPLEIDQEIQ